MNLSGLVSSSKSVLGARLSLVGLLPTTLLVLLVLVLVWGGAPTKAPEFNTALAEIAKLDAAPSALLVIAVLALALVLQPFQLLLVRLLEGYWGASSIGKALGKIFINRHRKKRARLQAELESLLQSDSPQAAEAGQLSIRIERFYPKNKLLPTRLGNVLRAGEENAGAPYGLDVVTIWPRLYAVLPPRTMALIDDQRNQLDIAVRFCVTFGAITAISAVLLFQHGWWLVVPVVTFCLAWISYHGAVASALAYGVGIRTAVDLHRFELLRTLHLPLPSNREVEKQANVLLSEFLRQGRPVDFLYEHSSKSREPLFKLHAPATVNAAQRRIDLPSRFAHHRFRLSRRSRTRPNQTAGPKSGSTSMRKKDLKAIEDYLARERGRDVGVPASPALFLPAATVVNSTGRLTSSLINRLWNEACGLPTSAARPRLLPVMPWVGNMKKTGQPRPCLAIIRRPDLFLGQGQATATSA